jgi:hypothetical protein
MRSRVQTYPIGTRYEEWRLLEISAPQGPQGAYPGNWNQNEFVELVNDYNGSAVGPEAKGIRIEGALNTRMRDNTFVFPMSGELDIRDWRR